MLVNLILIYLMMIWQGKDQLLDIILKIKKGDSNGFKDNTIS